MEYADGDKYKIVYSSPEAMVEFSGEKELKLSLSARQKPLCKIDFERSRYFFIRRKPDSPNPPLLSMVLVLGTSWCRFSRF